MNGEQTTNKQKQPFSFSGHQLLSRRCSATVSLHLCHVQDALWEFLSVCFVRVCESRGEG